MRVLELLSVSSLTVTQIATAMQSQPRTVRRVLARLVADEFLLVRQDGRSRVYEPTMRIVALAAQVAESSRLARVGRPTVELLHERTGLAAHLVVPAYDSVVCIVHADGPGSDVSPRVRELVPAHCTAGGRALLAWRDGWRRSVLAAQLTAHTSRTVTDPDELRRDLERVRRLGLAVEDGEYRTDRRAVAAPVLVRGTADSALVLSGDAVDGDIAAGAVRTAADQMAADLERVA